MNLLRRRKPPKMGVKDPSIIRSPGHRQWVRGFGCCIAGRAGHVCKGPIVAHHHRIGTDGGGKLQPSDCFVVPLCDSAHMEGHGVKGGWRTFEAKYKIDLRSVADELWRKSSHRLKFERKANG